MSNNQRKIQGSQFRARSEKNSRPAIMPSLFSGAVRGGIERQESRANQGSGCLLALGLGVVVVGCVVAQVVSEVVK